MSHSRSVQLISAREGVALLSSNIKSVFLELGLPTNHARLIRAYFMALPKRPRLSLAAFGRMSGLSRGHMSRIMCRAQSVGLVEKIGATWFLRVDLLRDIAMRKSASVIQHMREAAARVAERMALKLQRFSENVARGPTHTSKDILPPGVVPGPLPDHPLKRGDNPWSLEAHMLRKKLRR